jgi:hypothetical protein
VCFTNTSQQSVSVCVSLLSLLGNDSVHTFPRQRIQAKQKNWWTRVSVYPPVCWIKTRQRYFCGIADLLKASFSTRSGSYKRKVGEKLRLGKMKTPMPLRIWGKVQKCRQLNNEKLRIFVIGRLHMPFIDITAYWI